MARTKTTGFGLIQGRATDAVTDRDVAKAHRAQNAARMAARRKRARDAAKAAGFVPFTVAVGPGRSPDARRKVGQVQPAGWRM